MSSIMIVALVTSHLKISLEGRVVTGAISSAEKSARKKFSKELYFRTVHSLVIKFQLVSTCIVIVAIYTSAT
jgi:hypothetical protein